MQLERNTSFTKLLLRMSSPLRSIAWAHAKNTVAIQLLLLAIASSGCRVLEPQPIQMVRNNVPTDLIADGEPQIERGERRPIIDGFGWVWGVPSKLMLWNRKVENHNISPETEALMAEYLQANGLSDIKVRLNQYRPMDDWRRLRRNKSVAAPWRYTFGAVATLGETIIPGRLFGGDHYNPYTATIHLYSDVPAIAFHESAHAKDFSNRVHPGNYAALYCIPMVPLWHERIATNDVMSYVMYKDSPELRRQAYHVLYPAYGTYVGSAAGYLAPSRIGTPLYWGGVAVGHAVGRWQASQEVSDAN
jgi:hypothetical protein